MKALTSQQRAFLGCGATYLKDTVRNGKVIRRGEARSSRALVLQGQVEAMRDQDRLRERQGQAELSALIAASTVRVSHLKPGRARNAGYLNRQRAGALNMGFYKGSGFGS